MGWQRWIRTVEVEPSLYAADFSRLGEQVEVLLRAGARVFHFASGAIMRREKSISAMPSIPYTPNSAVWPCTGVRLRPCM